jgi:hypothetical protein
MATVTRTAKIAVLVLFITVFYFSLAKANFKRALIDQCGDKHNPDCGGCCQAAKNLCVLYCTPCNKPNAKCDIRSDNPRYMRHFRATGCQSKCGSYKRTVDRELLVENDASPFFPKIRPDYPFQVTDEMN